MELLYDHYSDSVYGIAFVITKNESEAEKIVKETFLYAWKHHSAFNETHQNFRLWLIGIARDFAHAQTSFDDFLKNRMASNYVSGTGNDPIESKMTGMQKKVFEMTFFGGGKIKEIAGHLSMDEHRIKQLLREAIHQYRKELQQA